LLFQPAEETGEGAERMLNDEKLKAHMPDYIFALHNIPGAEEGSIIVNDGVFAMASVGMVIKFTGISTHAAHPEKGISPAKAISRIIMGMEGVNDAPGYEGLAFATVIHSKLGEAAFGTQPGDGTLMLTLRAKTDSDIGKLKQNIINLSDKICTLEHLKCEISYTEEFKATVNNPAAAAIIKKAAIETNHKVEEIHKPFRWSEDFGRFTNEIKGAMFGLGAGGDQPELHNPNYNFPDELITDGRDVFYQIIKDLIYSKGNTPKEIE
jgi:metal-dependent amidase/aminoacylase/carboxypeptidase family protein